MKLFPWTVLVINNIHVMNAETLIKRGMLLPIYQCAFYTLTLL